ncbi:AlkA N-terminal domain-containing protein [Dongia sp.]|uniref:AlkA N-terminal domain-containing protein n=1 Tax=Dongia sp. TaxID=1977262 RepID=UPI0035B17BCE
MEQNLPPSLADDAGIEIADPGLDAALCYRALMTRDARFDGRFFVGVTSTGIYCRPICPAPGAKFENCCFYPSAAAAAEAGFRPCLRCRPETAPDTGAWLGTSNTVKRALALIAEGALDGEESSVETLAARVGVGERHLRRLFDIHLGASPISVAQTRRVHLAKQLIHETRLPMAEIALAAGFGSVRRFNETFRKLYQRGPSQLRQKKSGEATVASTAITVRLRYRPPYDWPSILAFFAARAVPGLEEVSGGRYRRAIALGDHQGWIEIAHDGRHDSLVAAIHFPDLKALPAIIARIRRVFDLGADVEQIGAHLTRDPTLAPLIAERPGLRAPGGWDGFEMAIRAILGQQVTIGAARNLAAKLIALCGRELPPTLRLGSLTHTFPTPADLGTADLSSLGMPGARRETLRHMALAAAGDPDLFRAAGSIEETVARLRAIKGIGDWSAHYIALRVVREPDAFPASDIGILRGATPAGGQRPSPQALLQQAEKWRPWRAYAAQHLWAADDGESNDAKRNAK